ncbi:MAG: hypothetical protein JWR16_384 [Nevskia sp.]|nr:hypothetical protein [Nevskia sp.]
MSLEDDLEIARQSSRRIGLAQISGLLALSLSVFALGISAYQTRVMQSQARASVWPYLAIGYSYYDQGADAGFQLKVYNHGVGPALIKSVRMTVDGKPIVNWNAFFKVVLGRPQSEIRHFIYSGFSAVQPPDTNRETTIEAIRLSDPHDAAKAYAAMDRLQVDICYCSVYDDCWIAHLLKHAVDAAPHCPAPGSDDFQS